jgi:glycosyltransferase involved in cell wall biosynthesis
MKILMFTNTYRPFTGGVPRSVDTFAGQYRKLGHEVKIVAPDFEGQEEDPDVFRVPALQHFNGTDFSVHLPIPANLHEFAEGFSPDIVHSHHPFLLGSTALRIAAWLEKPLVFTYHTQYERYLHYVPGGESDALRRFVVTLASGYANLTDHVIAPSLSIAEELKARGVTKPVSVVPTGVDVRAIAAGQGARFRKAQGIPEEAFVVGFCSRLAPEKNLEFLCDAVLRFLEENVSAWFVVAGVGPLEESLRSRFEASATRDRILMRGNLAGEELFDFYRALDVFAFASRSETQGLVVTEAMAAGVPVVALRGPGVQEVVRDGVNGRLLEEEDAAAFAAALKDVAVKSPEARAALQARARETAQDLSDEACARRELELYESVRRAARAGQTETESKWEVFRNVVATEWNLLANLGRAAGEAIVEAFTDKHEDKNDAAGTPSVESR